MIVPEQIAAIKILLVDDQKLHLHFLEKVLKEAGYSHIHCVSDPLKVLSAVQDNLPDILVLDLTMPQLDGFQIMQQLTNFRNEHYLPILALTSENDTDIRLRALQTGATDFLLKPYENLEILVRIRNMIEMRLLHLQVESQNKILERKVQLRTAELRASQLEIIHRLAQAAEFRDNDTGKHIIRMGQYCAKFAQTLGWDDAECELVLNASPLHDVGKIGIPDSILLKPGPLTSDEFEIMKTHTTIGGQILAGSMAPVMKKAQEIALTHHEKWNGTGYPNKLKEDEIPLVGQICSICDVFDALTSARPYKRAWTTQEAVDEITKQKGKHFNADLVDKFLRVLPEMETIKHKLAD